MMSLSLPAEAWLWYGIAIAISMEIPTFYLSNTLMTLESSFDISPDIYSFSRSRSFILKIMPWFLSQ